MFEYENPRHSCDYPVCPDICKLSKFGRSGAPVRQFRMHPPATRWEAGRAPRRPPTEPIGLRRGVWLYHFLRVPGPGVWRRTRCRMYPDINKPRFHASRPWRRKIRWTEVIVDAVRPQHEPSFRHRQHHALPEETVHRRVPNARVPSSQGKDAGGRLSSDNDAWTMHQGWESRGSHADMFHSKRCPSGTTAQRVIHGGEQRPPQKRGAEHIHRRHGRMAAD